ncbi:MAG: DUF433 domain-containing protein [Gaiellaceae bacterium]
MRVSAPTFDALDRRAHERDIARNALTERYIAEGVKMDENPGIAFREGALGRRAVLAGHRLDVWQVIETVRNSGNSVEEAAEYLGLPVSRVQAAVEYYAHYRDEVDDITEREHTAAERAEAAWRAGEELFA